MISTAGGANMRNWIDVLNESEKPVITPELLSQTILAIIHDWMEAGRCKTIREIGNGLCYDFCEEIYTRLGRAREYVYEDAPDLEKVATEDFWIDHDDGCFYADLPRLRSMGVPLPTDVPDEALSLTIGQATHEWVFFQGKHYDATCPEGAPYFVEMPFFKNQIEGLRKEIREKNASKMVDNNHGDK
jgi:hypothetical protein